MPKLETWRWENLIYSILEPPFYLFGGVWSQIQNYNFSKLRSHNVGYYNEFGCFHLTSVCSLAALAMLLHMLQSYHLRALAACVAAFAMSGMDLPWRQSGIIEWNSTVLPLVGLFGIL